MENLPIILLEEEDKETSDLREVVDEAYSNVCKLLDIETLKTWLKEESLELMVFGSRVRLQERNDSDLDLMLLGKEETDIKDNERNALYMKIKSFLLDKEVRLDVGVNLSTSGDFYGIKLGIKYPEKYLCDFVFDFRDIISCININKDGLTYKIFDSLENVYSDGAFLKPIF